MIASAFAALVLVGLPLRAWRGHRRGAPPAPVSRYVAETTLLTIALAGLLWRHRIPLEALGLGPRPAPRFLVDLAICLLAIVGPDAWLVWRVTSHFKHAALIPAPTGTVTDVLAARRQLPGFIAVASVGAVWEELCFRATILWLMPQTAAGILTGVIAGAVVFGAQHLRNGGRGMAYAAFFGVVFSSLYLFTGNLFAVIVAHAVGNVLTVAQWAPQIERARRVAQARSPAAR